MDSLPLRAIHDDSSKHLLARASFFHNVMQNWPKRHIVIDTRMTSADSMNSSMRNYVQINAANLQAIELPKLTMSDMENIMSTATEDCNKLFKIRKRIFVLILASCDDWLLRALESFAFSQETSPSTLKDKIFDYFNSEPTGRDSLPLTLGQLKEILLSSSAALEEFNAARYAGLDIALKIQSLLFADKVKECQILVEGTDFMANKYPYLQAKPLDGGALRDYCYPNEVIEGRLFIGDAAQAKELSTLQMFNITHVVNATSDVDNFHEKDGKIKYLRVDVDDFDHVAIADSFGDGYKFIDEVLAQPGTCIMVHCRIGKSRSATMVIMYLMKKYRMTYDKAYDFLKAKRELVYPNPGFVAQLERFDQDLRLSGCGDSMLESAKLTHLLSTQLSTQTSISTVSSPEL